MPDIIVFEGYLGGGKSLGAFKYALDVQRRDPRYVIYTNLKVLNKEINCKPIDFSEILVHALQATDFDDAFIIWLFDEIQNYFDARTSFDTKNRILSYFFSQTRKRHSHLIGTATDVMLGDIRFRDLVKWLIECSKREALNPRIVCDDADCPRAHVFKYEKWKILKSTKHRTGNFWIPNPQEYYWQYDSFDKSAPIEQMSKEQIERYIPKITNLGSKSGASDLGI